jgi:hypothetical protein
MRTAIIAAIVATLVSATSATAAFIVTSKNIKNGTIQLVDISGKAKRALKGQRGPAGPEGLTGPAGPAGMFTAQNVTLVTGPEATMQPGQTALSVADCGNGIPIGGGWIFGDQGLSDATVVESTRFLSRWHVIMRNSSAFTSSFRTVVTCAMPAP